MTAPVFRVSASGLGGSGYRHPGTGRIVPGVTTVLKQGAKPAIVQWAVDQTASYAVANIDALLGRTQEQGWGYLRWYHKRNPLPLEDGIDLRNYHLGVLDDAAELGTAMHEWAQADVDDAGVYPDTTMEPEAFWQMVGAWSGWLEQNFVECLVTEGTVWSDTEGYAGTFDGLWRINGKLYLIDIKTSRGIWPDHLMQLAALKNAETLFVNVEGEWKTVKGEKTWVGSYDEVEWDTSPIEGYGFIHIRPDDVDNKGNPIPAYCEFVEATDLDVYYDKFKGLLQCAKGDLILKEREKERAKSTK